MLLGILLSVQNTCPGLGVGQRYGADLGVRPAAADVGLVGCFRASERSAEIYEQASESSSAPYRQWSKGVVSWASE